jgi:hypothetical protein
MDAERDVTYVKPVARKMVASYREYGEAQRAVDHLADRKFPVERAAIVAEGISLVEQVTGRMGYGRAALNGAVSTAIAGALFGYIFGLFNWIAPLLSALNLAIYGLIFGAVLGAIFGLIFHAASGGQRDFSSVAGMQAERYNVMVDDEVAEEATRLLGEMR